MTVETLIKAVQDALSRGDEESAAMYLTMAEEQQAKEEENDNEN